MRWGDGAKNQRMVEEVLEQVRASGNDDDVVLEELPAAREEERSLLSVLRALQRSCGEGEDVAIELLGAQSELVSFVRGGKAVLYEGDALRVFHAGKQDWEILWRHFGSLPRHVFDTQVAAALLGYGGQCGYERLVRLCLSVELDKTGQYADWQKRPLSDQQIRYALGDVVYLARLYPLLRKRLEERGRLAWLEEIQAGSLDIEGYEQSGEESFLRLSTKMRGQEARKVLRRLCLWREGYAKRREVVAAGERIFGQGARHCFDRGRFQRGGAGVLRAAGVCLRRGGRHTGGVRVFVWLQGDAEDGGKIEDGRWACWLLLICKRQISSIERRLTYENPPKEWVSRVRLIAKNAAARHVCCARACSFKSTSTSATDM